MVAALLVSSCGISRIPSSRWKGVDRADTVSVDIIPDFSRVGYKYGDSEIPMLRIAAAITPAGIAKALQTGKYADTTACIQAVIDKVGSNGGGTILVMNGVYNISRILFLDYSNTVLKGESADSVIFQCNGTKQRSAIVLGWTSKQEPSGNTADRFTMVSGRKVSISRRNVMGAGGSSTFGQVKLERYDAASTKRKSYGSTRTQIDEKYVPVGSLYFTVESAAKYKAGDRIVVERAASPEWISDIGMDKISDNGRNHLNAGTRQWNPNSYKLRSERIITKVDGDRIYIDAPIGMSIDRKYGGGSIYKVDVHRITGSGVENLVLVSSYDSTLTYTQKDGTIDLIDEAHCWKGVSVINAEHCWVKNITTRNMGYCNTELGAFARNISVIDCTSLHPVSAVAGSRRYAFNITTAELCLFKGCKCENDRHGFVINGSAIGPNVFLDCHAVNMRANIGPHQRWSSCVLFDNVTTDAGAESYDAGNSGTGHGWQGVNYVFWNCKASGKIGFRIQNPWSAQNTPSLKFNSPNPSGRNYCVGCIGTRSVVSGKKYDRNYFGKFTTDYYRNLKLDRPLGIWYPEIKPGKKGTEHVLLPVADNGCSWWPRLTLKTFSSPESLYKSQLEDRHARGIYLN